MLCPFYFHLMLVLNVKASEACCRALAVSSYACDDQESGVMWTQSEVSAVRCAGRCATSAVTEPPEGPPRSAWCAAAEPIDRKESWAAFGRQQPVWAQVWAALWQQKPHQR